MNCQGLFFDCSVWHPKELQIVQLSNSIEATERNRLNKFVFKKDYVRGLIGQILIKYGLSTFMKRSWDEINLSRDKNGKPFLLSSSNDTKVDFNISHSGDYVIFGVTFGEKIGVDVMEIKIPKSQTLFNFLKTMQDNFDKEEWRQIYSFSDEQNIIQTFFRLWCLKESYLKCLGIGLAFELKRIKFILKTLSFTNDIKIISDSQIYIDGEEKLNYQFQEQLQNHHIFTVCLEKTKREDHFLKFEPVYLAEVLKKSSSSFNFTVEDQWKIFESKI